MSFAEKWNSSITDTPKSICKIDKTTSKKGLINIADINRNNRVKSGGDVKNLSPPKYICKIDKTQCKIVLNYNFQFLALLKEVGAYVRLVPNGPALVFDPPLDGEKIDAHRWSKALELENIFFEIF